MTAQASSDVKAFDAVHHPRHYNSHPSGIECVEYSELLPGNLSHVCVYVWRHADKEKPAEDLQKALWFLDREIARNSFEQTSSRRYVGGGPPFSDSIEAARIADRLRPLVPFVIEKKEFVATTVYFLFRYELSQARDLIAKQLNAVRRKEGA